MHKRILMVAAAVAALTIIPTIATVATGTIPNNGGINAC
jgi:hypothetical protein